MTNPYPGPQSVLVMDNAQIHHAEAIKDLVHGYGRHIFVYPFIILALTSSLGCRIKYLPPYSPDYNPIKQAFSVIKAHLCQNGISFFESDALYFEMYQACD
jgi:transposase